MLISFATLVLLAIWVALGVWGVTLLLSRPRARWLGAALVVEAALAVVAQVALSTIPFGIGEPLIRVKLLQVVLQATLAFVAVLGVGGLVYVAGRTWSTRLEHGRRLFKFAALLVAVPLVASGSLYGLAQASLPPRERERDPSKRSIKLPQGFSWSIYAEGTMDNPTTMTFGPDKKLYIGDISGTLWVATDSKGTGKVDSIKRFADGSPCCWVWPGMATSSTSPVPGRSRPCATPRAPAPPISGESSYRGYRRWCLCRTPTMASPSAPTAVFTSA